MFNSVRFVLIGFDSVSEAQYRMELVNGGGVDVGRYESSCTHVIVHGRVYDDPVCVAARCDGKTLVTELWVEDSLDIGHVADASRILYRPVKDLKGIPGAESLHICLTGYQRQDRDDIMKMVDLMGAQFSKPLIASRVTHLICYKFEGEKYELAKKIGKTLVNHRWLEDCLKAWEILPVDNYRKSSWELELMEAEARDSDEETEADVGGLSNLNGGSGTLIPSSELPTPVREAPKTQQDTKVGRGSPYITEVISTRDKRLLSPCKEINPDNASDSGDFNKGLEGLRHMDADSYAQEGKGSAVSSKISLDASVPGCRSIELDKEETSPFSYSRTKRSPHSEASTKKSSAIRYSRKMVRTSESLSTELTNHRSPQVGENTTADCNLSQLISAQAVSVITAGKIQIPPVSTENHHKEDQSELLPQKRKARVLSTPLSSSKKVDKGAVTTHRHSEVDPTSMMIDAPPSNAGSFLTNTNPTDKIYTVNQQTGQLVEPLKTTPTSIMKSGKHMQPESRDSCSPSGRKVTSLPCHVGPCHKLDKQKTKSDITNYTVTSASETDTVNTLELEAVAGNGSKVVKSFTMEKLPAMPSLVEVNNRETELIRLPNPPVSEISEPQKSLQDGEVSSPNRKAVDLERRGSVSNSSSLPGLKTSPGKFTKKLVAKKRIAHKPRVSASKTDEINDASYMDKTITSDGAKESRDGAEHVKTATDGINEMHLQLASEASDMAMENRLLSVNKTSIETEAMDKEILMVADKGKRLDAGWISGVHDVVLEEETHQPMTKTMVKVSGLDKKDALTDVKKLKRPVMNKPKSIASVKANMKRIQCSTTKISEVSAVDEKGPEMDLQKERSLTDVESALKASGVVMDKPNGMQCPVKNTMCKTSAKDNKEKSMDAEKENRPTENEGLDVNKHGNKKVPVQSIKKLKNNEVANGTNLHALHVSGGSRGVNCEPVWFILSGHRLQRKEFQQVIRRLRGRLCRDSHQWSYQATHFIVPDPVRRTEKFFAAAAAGRWILKTDYLTASNQAGRFLAEEPFEWFKKGLSEDGAISLEAPRKWRLLRERTSHGAFYGMCILVYGECVAPSLDTLKRVVKAGDGTILATSPPYSRFLKSGVDFAVIGPGMLRVDCWIQEFLRHEIPCIAADYLVDYVCKPGYSLERHVLYKTHAWAEESFANLLSRSEEVVQTLTPSEQDEDIACVVCGSRERGDVMLICGDEGGSLGCGIGTHIDCCDPPLEAVPKEDWFCSKCSSSMTSPVKKTKKVTSKKCK